MRDGSSLVILDFYLPVVAIFGGSLDSRFHNEGESLVLESLLESLAKYDKSETRHSTYAISLSAPAAMSGKNSTTVTLAPNLLQTEPISKPITPPPIKMRCSGTYALISSQFFANLLKFQSSSAGNASLLVNREARKRSRFRTSGDDNVPKFSEPRKERCVLGRNDFSGAISSLDLNLVGRQDLTESFLVYNLNINDWSSL